MLVNIISKQKITEKGEKIENRTNMSATRRLSFFFSFYFFLIGFLASIFPWSAILIDSSKILKTIKAQRDILQGSKVRPGASWD